MRCTERPLAEFVGGRLNFEAAAALSQHLEVCAGCRERTRVLAALAAIQRDRQKAAARRRPRSLSVAALVTLLIGLWGALRWIEHPPPALGIDPAELRTPYPYEPLETRSTSDEAVRKRAFQAYAAGEFETAARLLGELSPTAEVLFYQGVSLYLAGQPKTALEPLQRQEILDSAWREPGFWYRALALTDLERTEEALRLLESEEIRLSPYRSQAEALAEKLRRRP